VHSIADAEALAAQLGFPLVVRASFTLGGLGSGVVKNLDELREVVTIGIEASPVGMVLVEQCLTGWSEFELEVMRDRKDNVVIVCSIENFDPMGVHTGDSITVAPAQTLSDRSYQEMRDAAQRIIREIKVEAGGSNIQFAVDPASGRMVAIEMNPRVSRSSALASKATGFPIAKIAALLAVGYTLDEIPNDITRATPACFEPALDYVVVKIPRWAFEKFRDTDPVLGTRMKSVGEIMAIGPHVPRGADEGPALARARGHRDGRRGRRRARAAPRTTRARCASIASAALAAAAAAVRRARRRRHARGAVRGDRHRSLVPAPDEAHHRHRGRVARAQGLAA
jgi:carbamoyl-phosphate synthase large subunit